MVLSIEPFSRTPSPSLGGALLTPPPTPELKTQAPLSQISLSGGGGGFGVLIWQLEIPGVVRAGRGPRRFKANRWLTPVCVVWALLPALLRPLQLWQLTCVQVGVPRQRFSARKAGCPWSVGVGVAPSAVGGGERGPAGPKHDPLPLPPTLICSEEPGSGPGCPRAL